MAKNRDANMDDLWVQMKITNRLLAAPLKVSIGQKELVRLLLSTGASAAEIADVLDTTPATVATTIQRLKRMTKIKEVPGVMPDDIVANASLNE
jgi:DNA-binding CsgD family transcriptional regulator